MPKCPRCERLVAELINWSITKLRYVYDGSTHTTNDEVPVREEEYRCPECDAILFNNEEDAYDFLTEEAEARAELEAEIAKQEAEAEREAEARWVEQQIAEEELRREYEEGGEEK